MSLKQLFLLIPLLACKIMITNVQQPFTIIIEPVGDAEHTGRAINDTFERGITLQFAQEIKDILTAKIPGIRVVLTRVPGETIQPMHNALFANRLQAQLYIRVGFYHEKNTPSHIALFHYAEQKTDFWHKHNPLQFYDIEHAYLINLNATKELGLKMLAELTNKSINSVFVPYGLFSIPCKPLLGIQAPALYLEAGLHNKDDWKYLIQPFTACIQAIVS